ncbi:MAG TPA: class I SAM-dependent methyltransferase [Candidatus Kapabacteria bacterium]|nr:class I SAM-dependent methyltransferase [Candidatus Kapabacteria bacterium]HPO63008.1 class I SAM-dependent methyltransferase [Candidatus Kapabacteria bacterium]
MRTIGEQLKKPKGIVGRFYISKLMKKSNQIVYDAMLEQLELNQNDKIFEIGYGNGLGVNMIATNFDCLIEGVDFSKLMYNEARKRNKEHIENKKVKLYYGDFLKYNLPENCYDKIYCLNVVYFWDDLKIPFSKIRNGLKQGGIFCMYMNHRDLLNKMEFTKDDIFNKRTIEQVINNLEESCFKDISFKTQYGYYIKCRK